MRLKNCVGQKFGRLTVEARAPSPDSRAAWMCVCDCGNKTVVMGYLLRSGNTKSCGCLKREIIAARGRSHRTHGEATHETPEYRCWGSMLDRCRNPRHRGFKNYGGRGITVCERWHTYEHFLADMGRRPSRKHSIDRIDNDKNYEPANCRWATSTQQRRNTRVVQNLITVAGETKLLGEWLRETKMQLRTFYKMLARGDTPESILLHAKTHLNL